MKVHLFKAQRLGFNAECDAVWFECDYYTKEEAEAQFVPMFGTTIKSNGEEYSYQYYEYDGVKYYKYWYVGIKGM